MKITAATIRAIVGEDDPDFVDKPAIQCVCGKWVSIRLHHDHVALTHWQEYEHPTPEDYYDRGE